MGYKFFLKIAIVALFAVLFTPVAFACSMYKITVGNKTIVGNNEDSWGRDASIWFEPGKDGKYGVVNVGYARKHPNPDGAMNEYGLVFDGFTMQHKPNIPARDNTKGDFAYPLIKTIMQQCKTVDEVYTFLEKLNLHVLNGSVIFNGGMLLFVDKTGQYLVVEATKMTRGNDAQFLLANFSVAETKDVIKITMERYCKGVAFLQNKSLDTGLPFCTALSDTMSVSRPKIGDGTLYTSIYDLENGLIHLYFYHDFSKRITFTLKDELAKGEHTYSFANLFPNNKNYEKLISYQTPQSNRAIFIFLIACVLLFLLSAVYFLISFFKSKDVPYRFSRLALSVLGLAVGIYAYVLLRNEPIFFFPSPYQDKGSTLISLTSYLPIVLLLAIIPLLVMMVKIFKQKKWSGLTRWLFAANNLAFLILLAFFTYWKLFVIF